jgi:TatD DNase family protein
LLHYVDTHTHLDLNEEWSVAQQIEAAKVVGVTTMMTVGTDVASSEQVVATAQAHAADGVWAVVGIHPNDAESATPEALARVEELAVADRVVGIGETGLDYYRDWADHGLQAESFRAHIEIAKRTDRTLVIHCRDTGHGGVAGAAWGDTLEILAQSGAPDRVIMHCFSGDLEVTERCAEAGYFMSFAGNVTYKNAHAIRLAAAAAPDHLLLTETDAPFLSPVPMRGKTNQAANVEHTLAVLAECRVTDLATLAAQVLHNAAIAFALPAPDGAPLDAGA